MVFTKGDIGNKSNFKISTSLSKRPDPKESKLLADDPNCLPLVLAIPNFLVSPPSQPGVITLYLLRVAP
jgi:hypothetical protein